MKQLKTEVIRLTEREKLFIEQFRDFKQTTTEPDVKVEYKTTVKPLFYENGKSRVLCIGDIHAPFDLPEYLDHCKQVYKEFNCNIVVFIGDVIDQHFSSFHETNPDGFGAGEELDRAIAHLQPYYKAFPKATVILGNHDRLMRRKAFSGGIPKAWIKEYSAVLQVPHWQFTESIEIDGVLYIHGEGGTARTRIKSEGQSIVQGHLHTQAYIDWIFNDKERKFGMQVGTGIDFEQYAFAYAKAGKRPAISCGVILNGTLPFLIPMEL